MSTSTLRTDYRSAYAQLCYSRSDYEAWPFDEADRQALIEDRARLETLEFELRTLAPTNPDADPGWPGGWMRGSAVLYPHPAGQQVWRCQDDAIRAGMELLDLVWTPMCRVVPHDRWLLLDDHYWSGHDDVLVTSIEVR